MVLHAPPRAASQRLAASGGTFISTSAHAALGGDRSSAIALAPRARPRPTRSRGTSSAATASPATCGSTHDLVNCRGQRTHRGRGRHHDRPRRPRGRRHGPRHRDLERARGRRPPRRHGPQRTVRGFKVGVRSGGRGTTIFGAEGDAQRRRRRGPARRRLPRSSAARSTDNGYGHGICRVGGVSCRIDGEPGRASPRRRASRRPAPGARDRGQQRDGQPAGRHPARRRLRPCESTRNTVYANDGRGSGSSTARPRTTSSANTVAANTSGIAVTTGGTANRIEDNSISGSGGGGHPAGRDRARATWWPATSSRSAVRTASASRRARPRASSATRSTTAARDGIFISADRRGSRSRTPVSHNGDDGIDVEDRWVTLVGERHRAQRRPRHRDAGGAAALASVAVERRRAVHDRQACVHPGRCQRAFHHPGARTIQSRKPSPATANPR